MSSSEEKTAAPVPTEPAGSAMEKGHSKWASLCAANAGAAEEDESIAFGGADEVQLVSSPYQKMLAIAANLAILTELTIAMFFAAQAGDDFQPAFLKLFFTMLIPTLFIWIVAKKLLTRHERRQAKK